MPHPLSREYDELARLYEQSEKILRSLGSPVSVSIEMPDGQALVWAKCDGVWRLCYSAHSGRDFRPVVDCTAVVRVLCATYVSRLHMAIQEEVKRFSPQVLGAIRSLEVYVVWSGQNDRSLEGENQ